MKILRLALFGVLLCLAVFQNSLYRPYGATLFRGSPNIIFILTDDMTYDDLKFMPQLKHLVTEQGLSFSNYVLNIPLCCPSRATILRGQYGHNTRILRNSPPNGGFQTFFRRGEEKSTVATWLQTAGYHTALIGKYFNGYPDRKAPRYIPAGWSGWYSPAVGDAYSEYNYKLNENGRLVRYGSNPEDYLTDVIARKAVDFVRRMAGQKKPLFLYLAPYAPHQPATPAPRHVNLFTDVGLPRTPSFNEEKIEDKPKFLRKRHKFKDAKIQRMQKLYQSRVRSLQAVDELVANLMEALRTAGLLDSTYVFFSSDNGFHFGEHRLSVGKHTAYEEDIHVPLIVRGPGVPNNHINDALVGNVDLASTWAELAHVKTPGFVDGRSLIPLLEGVTPDGWRQAYLLQHGDPKHASKRRRRQLPEFLGIRTKDHLYVEYVTGEKELYDLQKDPYELENLADSMNPNLGRALATQVSALFGCSGKNCRDTESVTPPFDSH